MITDVMTNGRKPPEDYGRITLDSPGRKVEIPDTPLDSPIIQQPASSGQQPGGVSEPAGGFLKVPPRLGQIIQTLTARAEGAMQAFRLPGTNRVIHDNREAQDKKGPKDVPDKVHRERHHADQIRKEMQVREGRAEEVREKTYENYLAIRQMVTSEKEPAVAQKERQLSEFEKLLVERFEQSKKIEESSKDGKTSFLAKTVEQWRSFFAKFAHRASPRTAELADIQEFLFRGMVRKGDAKAVLISDIVMNSGRTDKFARFSVLYNKISGFLSKLLPGDPMSKGMLAEGLTSEKLMYLALQPPALESEILTGMKPKQGMFAAESTEARVASELGISYDKGMPTASEKGVHGKGKKRKGGGIFGLFGGDEEPYVDNSSGQFMPWWSWGNLKRPGNLGVKRALYSGIFILFILVMLFVIDRLLLK